MFRKKAPQRVEYNKNIMDLDLGISPEETISPNLETTEKRMKELLTNCSDIVSNTTAEIIKRFLLFMSMV